MASSLGAGGPGMVTGVVAAAPRRANLEFPPPPPYPPPQASQISMDPTNIVNRSIHHTPINVETTNQRSIQDYSYAYYEPGPSRLHPSYPIEATGVVHHHNHHHPHTPHHHSPTNSLQRNASQRQDASGSKRHTYVTRYGTEENID